MVEGEYGPGAKEVISPPEKEREMPLSEVAKKVELSSHRLRRLLNTGKISGEKRRREEGERGFPWVWHTSVAQVERYLTLLLSWREYGKRGGRPRKAQALGTRV